MNKVDICNWRGLAIDGLIYRATYIMSQTPHNTD
jgi:hypothetical protein